MSPENNEPTTTIVEPTTTTTVTQPTPPAAQPTIPALPDKIPNIQLGVNGVPLPKGPTVIGTKMFEVPDEAGQRVGFWVPPEMIPVIISQWPDFQFKERKPLG